MKKFFLLMLIFILTISSVSSLAAFDVTVTLDGKVIECKNVNGVDVPPLLIDGTTYLPVRAIATALNFNVEWDDETKSVFINGSPEKAEKSDNINIYLAGVKFIALDVNGKALSPVLKDGTTYLPVRAIGSAFGKIVSWDQETRTASLTTPNLSLEIDENKTYAIINKANGNAISLTDSGLVTEPFNSYNYQGFKFIKSETDGYYHIQSVVSNKNFDVNGNSKTPGAKIITYNPGTADNQKFKVEKTETGYIIYALSSLLPIEDSAGVVKQNEKRESIVQKWDLVEFNPTEKADKTTYYTITTDGLSLYNTDGLAYGYITDNADALSWILSPNENGEYLITNKHTQKSLDVANNSKTSGDPIIVYDTSGDPNQRWTLEKQSDGSYLIKSVHSSLYLSASENGVIHAELNKSYKQNWSVSVVK